MKHAPNQRRSRGRPPRHWALAAHSLAAVALLSLGLGAGAAQAEGTVAPGDRFVDFGMEALDFETGELGALVWLHHFVGPRAKAPKKLVLLSFFASWCEPCKRELPELQRLQRAYGERGLQVLAVNSQAPKEPLPEAIDKTRKMFEALSLKPSFPVLFERIDRNKLRYMGRTGALPCNVLIGEDGTVVARRQGKENADPAQLEALVKTHLEIE